jgi:thiamine biosynthesis lipoprotein
VSNAKSLPVLRRMRPGLGTFIEIGVFEPRPSAASAIAAAFAQIESISRLMSFQDPCSELSQLNAANGKYVRLSTPTLRALRLARALTCASGGLFNCTVGGSLVKRGVLPDHSGGEFLERGDAADLEIEGKTARLARPVRITLDGLAKGLAVDRALATLRAHGASHAWVNAGGDVRVAGHHALPVRPRGSQQRFELLNGAIASSGTNAGYDAALPGLIVGADLTSATGIWTVVSSTAWRADALTKVAALARPGQRESSVSRLGGHLVFTAESASRAA